MFNLILGLFYFAKTLRLRRASILYLKGAEFQYASDLNIVNRAINTYHILVAHSKSIDVMNPCKVCKDSIIHMIRKVYFVNH